MKKIHFLIDVLKELLKKRANYKLLTVGGNGLYDEFIKKIKQEHLEENYYSAGIQSSAKGVVSGHGCFFTSKLF